MTSIAGKVSVSAEVSAVVVRPKTDILDLHPIRTVSLTPERLPLYEGRPKRPMGWCEVNPLVSSKGTVFDPNAYAPVLQKIGSDIRFIADETTWDADAGQWRPTLTTDASAFASAVISALPVLNEVQLPVGKNVVRQVSGLLLTEQTRMKLSLGTSKPARTITLVLDPIIAYGTIPLLRTAGIEQTLLRYTDKFDFLWNGTGASVDPVAPLSQMSPVYLTLRIAPPVVSLFVSYSYDRTLVASQTARNGFSATLMSFDLGAIAPQEGFSYRLYEINAWDDALSNAEVISAHQKLMAIYGVDRAWS